MNSLIATLNAWSATTIARRSVTTTVWILDSEVRSIFAVWPCTYKHNTGFYTSEKTGDFIREQRSNEGSLGYVIRNPFTGENWLWVISKRNRRPFKLCRVN